MQSTPPNSPNQQTESAALEQLGEVVSKTWGFDSLRPLQADAMLAAVQRRDALVVLPTGGGKSLCYQAPALVGQGLTLVVSPLIALMKDQVDGLVQNGVAAAMWSSVQDQDERWEVRRQLANRELRLLFAAPERVLMGSFLDELLDAGLQGIAVDEAHCISHWGHDFRPEYRQIGELRERMPNVAIQAFTATAPPRVREDIVKQLALRDPLMLVGSSDRPNLTYRFQPRSGLVEQLIKVVRKHPKEAGIVYCVRRKDTEKLAAELQRNGVDALPYHAGMPAEQRRDHQDRFRTDDVSVICATVAFGMGIDRSDVRFVVHAGLPKGIEQYSQESGRAGRDGLPAECILFHSGSDYHTWKHLIEEGSREDAREEQAAPLSALEVESQTSRNKSSSMDELQRSLRRLSDMMAFATGATCRHKALASHFGDPWEKENCGACDVCLGEIQAMPDSAVLAQKILSCVIRCDQRYGAHHITDVLRGSRAAGILRAGHEQLSTWGLMRDKSAREVRHFIDQLLGAGHLRAQTGRYPALFLTETGIQVLKGDKEPTLFELQRAPRTKGVRPAWAQTLADEGAPEADPRVFDALRALRRKLASERGVPPYLIFSDRTLALIAAWQPKDEEAFRAIKGVGDKKAADLGPAFLQCVRVEVARTTNSSNAGETADQSGDSGTAPQFYQKGSHKDLRDSASSTENADMKPSQESTGNTEATDAPDSDGQAWLVSE